ncbi:uncharacterized protein ACA1_276350 [Acanthamoeba castellanii str. Neff]|uniref:Uncharacterized protein n=1 Tax=Acanthamoeba castellanii (strain ATCC 30010 / Neff) TaxID=1257118 RepID=L8GQZ2_ACACF|nr:uncharacterized protein ACA1_276350 [Acanthamoeba castellanii str. Neff]ELR15420.1 hypothetical protein ACA1_276350 [Acanthamoeba castellanii str. Neff]
MEAVELEDPSAHIKALWESHLELKTQLVTRDDFAWNLPSLPTSAPPPDDAAARGGTEEKEELRFIGGVDISRAHGQA